MRANLNQLCDIKYGYAFDSKHFTDNSDYPPLVRIRDVLRGYSETYFDGNFPSDYIVHPGDLLIGMDGEFNIARWKIRNALLNQRVCKITAKSGVNEEYLRFALSKVLKSIEAKTSFVTVKHLSAKELNNIVLDIPTIDEQNRIAYILTRLEHIIELRLSMVQLLDNLIKARFVEMFGNCASNGISLRECCLDVRGGGTPSMQHPEYYGGEVPFIKSGDVRGDMVSSGALWLTEQALAETTAKYVPKGSVLVVNRSAALLREFRAAIAVQPVVINQDIKAFIPKPEFTSEYLLWAIKIQTQFLLTKVTTVLTSHIDLKDLLELRIVPASIERQKAFSTFIAQVDKSKFVVQKALDKAQLLFDGLMQKYFG